MDFNHFLSAYLKDPAYGGRRLYKDMVAQAKQATFTSAAGTPVTGMVLAAGILSFATVTVSVMILTAGLTRST